MRIKIKYFQRYDFSNHIGWLLHKKPGGHLNLKNIANNKLKHFYRDFLVNTKMTDTLTAEATNI